MARGRIQSRGRSRRRSGTQWRSNSWSNRILLEEHEPATIVANELLTVNEYSDATGVFEDQVQGKATIIRIRGWINASVFGGVAPAADVFDKNAFFWYIAVISRAEVDSGVVLDPLEPAEDDAYSFQSIMATGGTVLHQFRGEDLNASCGPSSYNWDIDVPVMRRLEGDEQLYLVGLNVNILNVSNVLLSGVIRTLYRT